WDAVRVRPAPRGPPRRHGRAGGAAPLDVTPLAIPDVFLITPRRIGDSRGFFSETFNKARLAEIGIAADFVQDNHSFSARAGTIRGLHYQIEPNAQDKLVRVPRGAVLDVVV